MLSHWQPDDDLCFLKNKTKQKKTHTPKKQPQKVFLYMDIYTYIKIHQGVLHPEWNYISLETASTKHEIFTNLVTTRTKMYINYLFILQF